MVKRNLAAKGAGEAHQFVRECRDAPDDFLVLDVVPVESVAGSEHKARNDYTTKIQHQAVGVRHHGHVTAHRTCRTKKADDLVLPGAAGEFDHVFGRRRHVVIIDRRSDEYAVRVFDRGAQSFGTWHSIALIRITERQLHLANVDPITIDFLFLQMRKRCLPHSAAVAVGVAAGANH